MSVSLYAIILLTAASGILATMLAVKSGKLKRTQEKLDSKTVELSIKDQELEVIREVQQKIKTSNQRKAPEKTEPAAPGDFTSRIERLNRVSDNTDKA